MYLVHPKTDLVVGYCVSSPQCITELLQSSKSQRRLAGRARLSLSQTVLLSLTLLSERISYRTVSRRLLLEKGNIHRNFFSFCECISTQAERKITWPVGGLITVSVIWTK